MFVQGQEYYEGQQIIPAVNQVGGVWISGIPFASNIPNLVDNNIKAIISAGDVYAQYPKDFTHIKFQLDDYESQQISQCFERTYSFIQAQRERTNVLIHCAAGISRSSTLLISYLMRKCRYDYDQALKMVRQKRQVVQPNKGFEQQLKEYEKQVKDIHCRQG